MDNLTKTVWIEPGYDSNTSLLNAQLPLLIWETDGDVPITDEDSLIEDMDFAQMHIVRLLEHLAVRPNEVLDIDFTAALSEGMEILRSLEECQAYSENMRAHQLPEVLSFSSM